MDHGRTSVNRLAGSCFVSGMAATDGEELGAIAIVHALRGLGLHVTAMTPLVRDAVRHAGRWTSPHLDRLARAGSFGLPGPVLSPYLFPPAPSPALAARQAGARVEPQAVVETYQVLSTWADAVVVQGAGGLEEHLGPSLAVHDIAARLGLPLVLTLRADGNAPHRAHRALALARANAVRLAGWLAVGVTSGSKGVMPVITNQLGMEPFGVLPAHLNEGEHAARHLDLQALRRALELPGDSMLRHGATDPRKHICGDFP